MPTRSSSHKRKSSDPILVAARIFQEVTGEPVGKSPAKNQPPAREKNPHAVALGKLGGPKGGKARAAKLSARERSSIAREAALSRWTKRRKASKG
jgi:hypothetical protein